MPFSLRQRMVECWKIGRWNTRGKERVTEYWNGQHKNIGQEDGSVLDCWTGDCRIAEDWPGGYQNIRQEHDRVAISDGKIMEITSSEYV